MTLEGLLFIGAFVGFPGVVVLLMRYAGVPLTRISIPSVLVLFYILFAYFGILPLYFHLDPGRVAMGVTSTDTILTMFGYTAYTLLALVVGFVFAHQFMGLRAHRGYDRPIRPSMPGERWFFVGLLIACVAVLALYLYRVPAVALFVALQGSVADALVARGQMGNAFTGAYWRYELFFRTLLMLCCLYFYVDARVSKSTFSRALFLVALPFTVFAGVMAIEKAPVVYLIVALYLAYAAVRGGRLVQPALKWFVLIAAGGIAVMYVVFAGAQLGADGAGRLVAGVASRIFTGSITPAYFYLEMFPQQFDFLWGASFPNPGGVLPFESVPVTREVSVYMAPEAYRLGIVGSAPTVFWAELYANFGPLGVCVAPFFIGVGIYAVQHLLTALAPSPTTSVAILAFAMHFQELSVTGISGYLFDTTAFALIAVLAIALVARRFEAAVGDHFSTQVQTFRRD